MTIEIKDLIGYILAIVSGILALYIYYKSKLDSQAMTFELTALRSTNALQNDNAQLLHSQQTKSLTETHVRTLKTINNIAFTTLLRVKNVAIDHNSLRLQYESLVAGLQAVQKIAQENGQVIFQGEYVYGLELGAIEDSESCAAVWLITQDLRPDIDEFDLLQSVAKNLDRNKKYTYIVPNDLPMPRIHAFLKHLEDAAAPSISRECIHNNLRIYLVNRHDTDSLFSGGVIALYEVRQTNDVHATLYLIEGFDEIVLPSERRGSTWQRQAESRSKALHQIATATIKSASTQEILFAGINSST